MLRTDIHREIVPTGPGVYQFLSPGERILYIGKAINIKKRLQQYFTPSSVWKQDMVAKAARVQWFPVGTDQEALILETNLITTHKPVYNNLIKGNSSYVYVKLRHEPFPNIELTRYKKNDQATYLGPKLWKRDLSTILKVLRQIFQFRSCTSRQFKAGVVCSDYFFGLCKGRCAYSAAHRCHAEATDSNESVGFAAETSYDEAVEEYTAFLGLLKKFLKGNAKPLLEKITSVIDQAISQEHFERAAKLRDGYYALERMAEKQQIILDQPRTGIYVQIQHRNKRLRRVVLSLYQGKIIDILTGREHSLDTDIDELLRTIGREYTCELTIHHQDEKGLSATALTPKRISKSHLTLLDEHATSFLASYSQSLTPPPPDPQDLLKQLQSTYQLKSLPEQIECVDISHFGGDHTVGGLSYLLHGRPQKTGYRHYKIKQAGRQDDYAALRELIIRRFQLKRTDATPRLPDLLIIDGGKGQLTTILSLQDDYPQLTDYLQQIDLVSIAKGTARSRGATIAGAHENLLIARPDGQIDVYPLIDDQVNQLLRVARDEAHRFANRLRKKLMNKEIDP